MPLDMIKVRIKDWCGFPVELDINGLKAIDIEDCTGENVRFMIIDIFPNCLHELIQTVINKTNGCGVHIYMINDKYDIAEVNWLDEDSISVDNQMIIENIKYEIIINSRL